MDPVTIAYEVAERKKEAVKQNLSGRRDGEKDGAVEGKEREYKNLGG